MCPRATDPRALPKVLISTGLLCLATIGGCSQKDAVPTGPWGRLAAYEHVLTWGDSGTANGQFQYPQGVAVDAVGKRSTRTTRRHL